MARPLRIDFVGGLYHVTTRGNAREAIYHDDDREMFLALLEKAYKRHKAIRVEKHSYLLELARYIVLNPVRAGMVRTAQLWKWSSYRATAGFMDELGLVTTDWLLSCFSGKQKLAQERYRAFVQAGKNEPSPWESLNNQIYPGSDALIEER